jgi:hypothetical protein
MSITAWRYSFDNKYHFFLRRQYGEKGEQMQARLLGFSAVDFTANDGHQIKGVSLYIAFADENITGERTERIFVRDGITIPKIGIGDTLDISFDMRGKAESVQAAKA